MTHHVQHLGAVGFGATFISSLAEWSPLVTWSVGLVTLGWYAYQIYKEIKK